MIFRFKSSSCKVGSAADSCKVESSHEDSKSSLSNYVVVPVQGKQKNPVSDRIVRALRNSNFCSSSPVIKSLIVQNVQVCCIVIETSGTKSIKVICASIPYLLNLLARANPKFKRLLEDENVASYMKFFKETDLESLLNSVITATVIIQNGLKACYPTLCIQLSRDALLFSEGTFKSALKAVYKCLLCAFQFVWEDLGPVIRSLCSQHRHTVKMLTKQLPILALAATKGLVLFSFLVRRVICVVLRSLKNLLRTASAWLNEFSLRDGVLQIIDYLRRLSRLFVTFATSGIFRCACKNVSDWCVKCSTDFIPIVWEEFVKLLKQSKPLIRSCIKAVVQFIPALLAPNGHLVNFIKFCNSFKPVFFKVLKIVKSFIKQAFELIIQVKSMVINGTTLIAPHCNAFIKYFLRKLINFCRLLLKWSINTKKYISNLLVSSSYQIVITDLCHLMKYIATSVAGLCRTAITNSSQLLRQLEIHTSYINSEVLPIASMLVFEINSTLVNATKEVVIKSTFGVKRVVPSVLRALRTVSPETYRATCEVFISSKNSALVMTPVFLKALKTMRPELFQMVMVVLQDGNRAGTEIVRVYCVATSEMVSVSQNLSNNLPVVRSAVSKVIVMSYNSVIEIFVTSSKARSRVMKDTKKAISLINSSAKSAELEILHTFRDILVENPDVSYVLENLLNECIALSGKTSYLLIHRLYKLISSSKTQSEQPSQFDRFLKLVLNPQLIKALFVTVAIVMKNAAQFVKFSEKYKDSIVRNYIRRLAHFVCTRYLEILQLIAPKYWEALKYRVFQLWVLFCVTSNDIWMVVELLSSQLWRLTCHVTPEIWSMFKCSSKVVWDQTCVISPYVWDWIVQETPVAWDFSRKVVQRSWELHLQTCSTTWEVAVPLFSSAWDYTVYSSPKIWVVASENSKFQWKLFCDVTETGWEIATSTGFSSWELIHQAVSKTWRYGLKPITISLCCNTSTILTKSFHACAGTRKVILSICDDLTGKRIFNLVYVPSKLQSGASATRDILKKCLDFSRAKFSPLSLKKIELSKSVISKAKDVSSQMMRMYSNFGLELVKNNIVNLSKLPFLPAMHTYTLSHEFLRKCYTFPKSYDKYLISGNPILFIH